jgi:hypothetical protein
MVRIQQRQVPTIVSSQLKEAGAPDAAKRDLDEAYKLINIGVRMGSPTARGIELRSRVQKEPRLPRQVMKRTIILINPYQ